MHEAALSYLGLAKKAGHLEAGDELVRSAVRAGHARLIVLAADAGAHTRRRAENLGVAWHVPVIVAEWPKDDLGHAVGTRSCAFAAFTEPRLALAFLKALNRPENESALVNLEAQARRADERQKEARSHESNVKHGAAPRRKRTK